jgi:hypothetical protein
MKYHIGDVLLSLSLFARTIGNSANLPVGGARSLLIVRSVTAVRRETSIWVGRCAQS